MQARPMQSHLHAAKLRAVHAGPAGATAARAWVGAPARAHHHKVLGRGKHAGDQIRRGGRRGDPAEGCAGRGRPPAGMGFGKAQGLIEWTELSLNACLMWDASLVLAGVQDHIQERRLTSTPS